MTKAPKFNLLRATTADGDVRLIIDDSDDLMLSELRDELGEISDEAWAKVNDTIKTRGVYHWRDQYRHRREARIPADFELDYMAETEAALKRAAATRARKEGH